MRVRARTRSLVLVAAERACPLAPWPQDKPCAHKAMSNIKDGLCKNLGCQKVRQPRPSASQAATHLPHDVGVLL